MNRIADLYQKSDTDACVFTRRGDMAELLMVNPSTGASKHIYMYAPVKLLEQKLVPLVNKGYKLCNSINICLADKVINGIETNWVGREQQQWRPTWYRERQMGIDFGSAHREAYAAMSDQDARHYDSYSC